MLVVVVVTSVKARVAVGTVKGSGASTAIWIDGRSIRSRTWVTSVVLPDCRGPVMMISHPGLFTQASEQGLSVRTFEGSHGNTLHY